MHTSGESMVRSVTLPESLLVCRWQATLCKGKLEEAGGGLCLSLFSLFRRNNAEGGQYPHEIRLFATNPEERDSYRSFRCSNHQFLLSQDTRIVAAGSVKCLLHYPRRVPAFAAAAGLYRGCTAAADCQPLVVFFLSTPFSIFFLKR